MFFSGLACPSGLLPLLINYVVLCSVARWRTQILLKYRAFWRNRLKRLAEINGGAD
jgi:hypothetical protein